jgi:hypothetical protein
MATLRWRRRRWARLLLCCAQGEGGGGGARMQGLELAVYRWKREGRGRPRWWWSSDGGGRPLKLSGALGAAVSGGEGARRCECATAH